ncbi:hypothetical protein Tco_0002013 [Tanacetum coccineum]
MAEVQDNQLKAADTTEVPEKIVKKEEVTKEQTLEIPTVTQLLDEVNKAAQETPQNPDDTKLEIKVVKSFFTSYLSEVQDQTMNDYKESAGIQEDFDSDLQSMPDDDLRSVSGFEAGDSDNTYDNEIIWIISVKKSTIFIQGLEIWSLMSIVQAVSDEIKSSLPAMITNTLQVQLPGVLSATLKDCFPLII